MSACVLRSQVPLNRLPALTRSYLPTAHLARLRSFSSVAAAEYEDYSATSATYDEVRRPIGLDSLNDALSLASSNLGRPVRELRAMDVGCGTGNYLDWVKEHVGQCTGVEYNEGMLKKSQAKHAGDSRVTLLAGSVLDLPDIESESQDVVIMTQVLHHLTPDTHGLALSNISRVLKKGGTFWISTQTPHQHMEGFWWAPLIPQAAATLAARFPGLPLFAQKLQQAGLKQHQVDVPPEPLIQRDYYLDMDGPFKSTFRNGDSTWALASAEELEAGQAWWKQQLQDGTAQEWLHDREKVRSVIGQTTAVTAVKV